ncbi:MAG: glycosyltransferase family 4 protein [Candidatus Komeilibacteria bacterium]
MKNILILTQQLYPRFAGGSAKVAWQQALTLAEENNITVITPGADQNTNNVKIIGYPINTRSQSINDLKSGYQAIKNELAKKNYDQVIIHHPYIGKAFLKCKNATPYTYMFHASTALETKSQGLDLEHQDGLKSVIAKIIKPFFILITKRIENKLLKNAEAIWVFSEFSKKIIQHYFPKVQNTKIQLITYQTPSQFQPGNKEKLREEYQIKPSTLVALTIRRLVPRMGIDWLIDNWRHVLNKYPNIKLYIIGTGYLEGAIRKKLVQKNLTNQIFLLGKLSEQKLIDYYQLADFFVLPTKDYEGLGLVTLEALACGLPVIGTNIGATPEILNKVSKHLVMPTMDSAALLNAIDYVLINRENLDLNSFRSTAK